MTDPRADVDNLQHVWRRFCAELAEAGDVLARPSSPTTEIGRAHV